VEERRIRRTKNTFKRHLIELVKEKGYSAVTVTDIVVRADYNRSTFYTYYLDKEDLASQLIDEMMTLLNDSFFKPFKIKKMVQYEEIENHIQNTFFQHIYENRHFYELLSVSNSIPNLKERFLEEFKKMFLNIRYLDEMNNIINIEHYNTYKMYGSYGIILEWVTNGCKEDPNQFSATLLSIFQTPSTSIRFN
jgi:AcrR family transcriptional regulator